jgi:(1->4)-alpha-D-glucan 1-alpha-D-glucosylmutase
MLKAVREAKVHTSWVNPYAPYEHALARFVEGLLGKLAPNRFLQDFLPLMRRIARHGCINSLAQTLLKLTSPGVPDFYQGTELWQLALVDPDNRRAVDYPMREHALDALRHADPHALLESWPSGRVKLWLVARVLALRRERAAWFERAGYLPIAAQGAHAARLLAYARTGDGALLVSVVPRLWSALSSNEAQWPLGALWGDTRLALPRAAGGWRNVLTGERIAAEPGGDAATVAMRDVLAAFPVALLEPA